jgi:hypothetical protein
MRPQLTLLLILLLTYACVSSYLSGEDRVALQASSSQNNGNVGQPAELADDQVIESMLPFVLPSGLALDDRSFGSLIRMPTISDSQKLSSFSRKAILLI